jgi:hypothetical protein
MAGPYSKNLALIIVEAWRSNNRLIMKNWKPAQDRLLAFVAYSVLSGLTPWASADGELA